MFQLTLNQGKDLFDVRFTHGYIHVTKPDGLTTHRRVTVCDIYSGNPGDRREQMTLLCTGSAVCSEKDTFSKDRGRKLALSRALRMSDKEMRAKFFDKYHLVSGHLDRMRKDANGFPLDQEMIKERLAELDRWKSGVDDKVELLMSDAVQIYNTLKDAREAQ